MIDETYGWIRWYKGAPRICEGVVNSSFYFVWSFNHADGDSTVHDVLHVVVVFSSSMLNV